MSSILEQKQWLDNLLLSEDLEELNNRTNQFNVFNALKLQNNEIRHSNFLGWLMTPYENHELGDYFLKEFLKEAIKSFSQDKMVALSLSDIAFTDFSDCEIKREHENIDILIINSKQHFLCVIENKIWTGEHNSPQKEGEEKSQLIKYAEYVNNNYPTYNKLFIYLAPNLEDNSMLLNRSYKDKKGELNSVYYVPMTYEQVYRVINKVLKFKSHYMNSEVKVFIEHYKKMIERNIMGNTDKEIVDLCRKIYRENKEAINLIIENSDERAEIFELFVELLKERIDVDKNIVVEGNTVKFLPKGINNTEKLAFGEFSNNMIVNLHSLYWGKKPLYIEIAVCKSNDKTEENYAKRNSLIEHIRKYFSFKKFNGNDDWAYSPTVTLIEQEELASFDGNKELIKSFLSKKLDECGYIEKLKEALNSWQG